MLQRISFKKVLSQLPKCYRLNQFNQISNDTTKDDSTMCDALNTEEPSKDPPHNEPNEEEVLRMLNEAATFNEAKDTNWATTPYPKDAPVNQNQSNQRINPETTSVFLFPGQGTIKVGMIKKYIKFPDAKDLFEMANEITGYNVLKLCLDGPQSKLNRTEFNQVATVVSSLAALEKVREDAPKAFEHCVAAAGYSIGEITALIFSGAITFEDGIKLAWARGKAMQSAADKVPQGMLSVFCTPAAKVSEACKDATNWAMDLGIENPVCRTAIFLCTQRKILGGNMEALEYIERHHEKYGLTNVNKLPVSGAFHTPLMEPALESVFRVLEYIHISEPRCKVLSNYKAEPYLNLKFMKKFILKQIVAPVRWEQCLQKVYSRAEGVPFPQTYDIGSEGRMKTILKLINAKACNTCTVI